MKTRGIIGRLWVSATLVAGLEGDGVRTYTLLGATDVLQAVWDSIEVDSTDSNTRKFREDHSFFKVKVNLPKDQVK